MFTRVLAGTLLAAMFGTVGAAEPSDTPIEFTRRMIEAQITIPRLAHIEYCATAQPQLADVFRSEIEPFKAAAAQAARELAPRYAGGMRTALGMRSDQQGAEAAMREGALSLARQVPVGPFCRQTLRSLGSDSASRLTERHGKILDTFEEQMKKNFPNGIPEPEPEPGQSNLRIAELKAADDADREKVREGEMDMTQVIERDTERRTEARLLISNGKIRTAADYLNAALILQHGEQAEDNRLAHSLATISMNIDPSSRRARFLVAATWDRLMWRLNHPQWYATQFIKVDGRWILWKVDESAVSDDERMRLAGRTLADSIAFAERMNEPATVKE